MAIRQQCSKISAKTIVLTPMVSAIFAQVDTHEGGTGMSEGVPWTVEDEGVA